LAALAISVALHQFITSQNGVLSPWKGGGFGMYTTPHGVTARATFLIVDGHPLRLAPPDPAFTAWVESVDPSSASYLKDLQSAAAEMRTYPRAAAAERLLRQASRVVWDGDLFGTWSDPGQQPTSAMSVTVIELAHRPSQGVIDTRVVFSHAGQ
jgi:hypothetical protein